MLSSCYFEWKDFLVSRSEIRCYAGVSNKAKEWIWDKRLLSPTASVLQILPPWINEVSFPTRETFKVHAPHAYNDYVRESFMRPDALKRQGLRNILERIPALDP